MEIRRRISLQITLGFLGLGFPGLGFLGFPGLGFLGFGSWVLVF